MSVRISIIIVSFNCAHLLSSCLASIRESTGEGTIEVIVVDNASTDNTREKLKDEFPDILLITNEENRGYAAACNQGIQASHGEYLLLLNPDTILRGDTIQVLVDHLQSNSTVGIVGPRLVQSSGELQKDSSATGSFPGFLQALYEYTLLRRLWPTHAYARGYLLPHWDRRSSRQVAMVQGACMMFRRALIDDVGLLDEQFFLYFEETDFCKRADEAGWKVHFVAETECIHHGAGTMPGGIQHTRAFFSSFYRYHRKHGGRLRTGLLRIILSFSFALESAILILLMQFRKHDVTLWRFYLFTRIRLREHLRVSL